MASVTAKNVVYLFSQVLPLFQPHIETIQECVDNYAFIRYFDITSPIDKVEIILRKSFFHWATKIEIDQDQTSTLLKKLLRLENGIVSFQPLQYGRAMRFISSYRKPPALLNAFT